MLIQVKERIDYRLLNKRLCFLEHIMIKELIIPLLLHHPQNIGFKI
jgi:hypothetical protein